MVSRIALSLAIAAAFLPATAQARSAERAPQIVQRLSDPVTQAEVSIFAAAMSQMLLDLKIGPLAKAMGPLAGRDAPHIAPDARLSDVIGPDARHAPAIIAREVPQMMAQMAGMAGAMQAMLPQLQNMARQMQRAMERSQHFSS